MNMQQTTPPAGFRENRNGHLVPESQIKAIDLARDELVSEIIKRAVELRQQLQEFKVATFNDIAAFVQLSAEQYGATIGGTKGNVTLISYDGRYKVVRAIQDKIQFDERLQAAKKLIDACFDDWTFAAAEEARTVINDTFQVDKDGNVSVGRVLSLRRYQFNDPRWKQAMVAIADAVTVIASKSYVRFYERDDRGMYQPISLDMAVV